MPEGPSIRILRELLDPFTGDTVMKASAIAKGIDAKCLEGQKITAFKTWGKNLLICFPEFTIRIHLMMFGMYRVNEHRDKPAKLGLYFDDGEINFYACVVELLERPLDELYDWQADVMNPHWSTAKAIKKLRAKPEMLACDALMDQHIFAGVGNIIKNEALFRARVHPESKVGDMPPAKLKQLIAEAVHYSFDFLKWKKAGILKRHWEAYDKKTCPRDHVALHEEVLGKSKRRTFYCDVCQKLYA
ncbi:endonuclease [Mucilaginibacter sp. HMF5004]|uniref:DNA-formamidopyrimidine glycosylase family protein n=1 Tax=Mucilaginibacter rivuli TaxID=2857527 RepID=UPI001C5EE097|nr:DNA-formamidopyrimidine glycosylase family protein [Mucilaginibacter rivuli]MBW4890165.1 endonuclease [Mucilaginibacter rivuli]